jgi:hypothetical protein
MLLALVVLEGLFVTLQLMFDHESIAWLSIFYLIEVSFAADMWIKAHVGRSSICNDIAGNLTHCS